MTNSHCKNSTVLEECSFEELNYLLQDAVTTLFRVENGKLVKTATDRPGSRSIGRCRNKDRESGLQRDEWQEHMPENRTCVDRNSTGLQRSKLRLGCGQDARAPRGNREWPLV